MRFIVMLRSTKESEAGLTASPETTEAIHAYNQELIKAGVRVGAQGLRPSSDGVRVRISGGRRSVIDGPFTETKELINGFWLIQVQSKEEAIEWVKRAPNCYDRGDCEFELRQIWEIEDVAEMREQ